MHEEFIYLSMPHHPPHVLTRKESQLDVQTHATPDNTFLCVMYVINCMSAVIRRKEMLHGLHTVSIKAILTLGSVTLTFNRFFNLGFFGIRFFSPMHDMMRVRARARFFTLRQCTATGSSPFLSKTIRLTQSKTGEKVPSKFHLCLNTKACRTRR